MEWEWYTNSDMVHLFIHLLINANHKDGLWNGTEVKRGQFVTGYLSLSRHTGISIRTIRTCIKRLKSTSEITIQTTNKYSIITINKYDSYQFDDKVSDKPKKRKSPSKRQANDNKQECKEVLYTETLWKNDFSVYLTDVIGGFKSALADEQFMAKEKYYFPELDLVKTIQYELDHYWATEKAWNQRRKAKTVNLDWKATISSFLKRNYEKGGFRK